MGVKVRAAETDGGLQHREAHQGAPRAGPGLGLWNWEGPRGLHSAALGSLQCKYFSVPHLTLKVLAGMILLLKL